MPEIKKKEMEKQPSEQSVDGEVPNGTNGVHFEVNGGPDSVVEPLDLTNVGTPRLNRVSWSMEKELRDSPERESPGGSGRSTPRTFSVNDFKDLRRRKRWPSGQNKDKFENVPPLSPLTAEGFKAFREYLILNNFGPVDIGKTITFLLPDSVLEDCPDQKTVLHVASEEGHPALAEALLIAGHSSLCRTCKGYTPLHLAVFRQRGGVVKKLLAAKEVCVNEQTDSGHTALHIAVMVQNHDAVKMIREKKGSDFGLVDNIEQSALHMAAQIYKKVCLATMEALDDDTQVEESLIEACIEIEEKVDSIIRYILQTIKPEELIGSLQYDSNKYTPLHHFAELDAFAYMRIICEKFERPMEEFELKNPAELTPFLICVGKMFMGDKLHMDNIMQMIQIEETMRRPKKGRKVLRRQESIPDSPLSCAKHLLERMPGETIDHPHTAIKDMTALQIILKNIEMKYESCQVERDLVEMLLAKGADVLKTHSEKNEEPIVTVNTQNFDKQMSFLFIEHLTTENINQQDEQGETVLHWAVSHMAEDRMELLLKKGANIMVRDRNRDRDEWSPSETQGELRRRTPLLVALRNDACSSYFAALCKVGIEKVVDNVDTRDLMEFLETHIAAAAFTKNNQVLRELCQYLSRGSCFPRLMEHSNMTKKEIIYNAVHYLNKTHFEKTFHKTALAWTNENDDPISASDLLHFEYQTHDSKREGLHCMKEQLTNDKLLYWMTRTFSKFYTTPSYIRWSSAILVSVLQLGLSYFFYLFDIVSDLALTNDYHAAFNDVDNYTLVMWKCALGPNMTPNPGRCFIEAEDRQKSTYEIAYGLTIFSMVISIAVYIIGIVVFFDSKNITEKIPWFSHKKGKGSIRRVILKYGLLLVIRIFWPFFHIYRRIRYEASINKSNRRKNLIEFESIWVMVKTIEYGIEATVQLIIVLYLLVPFYDQLHDWDFQITVQRTFNGIAHFMTGGRYPACLLEKVVGKLFINVFVQSLSLTTLRYVKYGMSIFEHLSNMWPLFLSNLSQIVARILVLRVFFVTAEGVMNIENKGLAITLFFLVHFVLTFLIKITFEVQNEDYRKASWVGLKAFTKFLINLSSSSIVYTWSSVSGYGKDPRSSVDEHNTFLPQTMFQFLILVEHLVLVLLPLSLTSPSCLDSHTFRMTAYLVPSLWLFSNICLIFHYKNFHTWSQTNGPNQTLTSDSQPKGMSCITGFCCFPHLYKVTLDSEDCLKVENITSNMTDFKLMNVPGANGFEMKSDIVNSEPLLK